MLSYSIIFLFSNKLKISVYSVLLFSKSVALIIFKTIKNKYRNFKTAINYSILKIIKALY